jgi:hypothetical protein
MAERAADLGLSDDQSLRASILPHRSDIRVQDRDVSVKDCVLFPNPAN